jgi:hypothetical protein
MKPRRQGRVDRMRTALALAALTLSLGGLVGCGGDGDGGGDIPANASKDDFCGNFQQLADDLGAFAQDPDAEPADAIEKLQDASESMRDTGVPDDASDDERDGLVVTLDAIDSLDADATLDDLDGLEDDLSDAEQEKSDAFDDYLEEECGDLG